jgi:2-iminobutanoate/2-iminopropanoate deaminase
MDEDYSRRTMVFGNKCLFLYTRNPIKTIKQVKMKAISTDQAPAAIGPYSQAIHAGNLVFVSGQLPVNPATGEFAEGGIKELTRQSLTNMKHILEAEGLTLGNVVKTTVFLADMADFAEMNEVYSEFFATPYPARSAVAVKTLPKNARVEIECIAAE